jgi:uncharacterized protein YoxC
VGQVDALLKESRDLRQKSRRLRGEIRGEIAKLRQSIHAQRTVTLIMHDLIVQGDRSVFHVKE